MQRIRESQTNLDWLPSVATYTDLIALSTTKFEGGEHCVVRNTNIMYKWTGTTWEIANDTNIYTDTKEPTGFLDRTAVLSFVNITRTFTITGEHSFYYKGIKIVKNTTSIAITNTVGIHYIYYSTSYELVESTNFPGMEVPLVSFIYWNGSVGLCTDERHGCDMDYVTHQYLHETTGVRYGSGLTGTFANNTFSVGAGSIWDEDIKITIPLSTQCDILYLDGSSTWQILVNQTNWYKVGTRVQYNNGNVLTDGNAGFFIAYWIFATNSIGNKIISIMGQRQDGKLIDAQNNNKYESLIFTDVPFKEMKLLYRVIVKNDGIVQDVQDLRNISNMPSGTYVATQHDVLTGIQGGGTYHLSYDQHTDLTDSGDCTLHYHFTEASLRNSADTVISNNVSNVSTALSTETVTRDSTDTVLSTAINDKSNVTSSTTNGNIKINGVETIVYTHPALSLVEVYRNTTQTISNSIWTKVQFNTEVIDSKNEYNNSSTYRFTASTAGRYLVIAGAGWNSMKGYRAIAIYKNGATTYYIAGHGDDTQILASNSTYQRQIVTGTVDLAINDYVEIFVYQDVGTYNLAANETRMSITQLT